MTPSTSPFVLVPGYWLGEWAWQTVQARLEQLGHPTNALTLPGLESTAARRDGVTFADHVNCVAAAVGALPVPVVLVAHSGAGAIATAVADRMPASLARVVYVDSGPVPDGHVPRPDVPADQIELPVPGFDDLVADGASIDGLSDGDWRRFRTLAVPHPAGAVREQVRLHDDRRNLVPTTLVCCSIASEQVRALVTSAMPMFAPVNELVDVTLVDLPTGHWPMLSCPDDLADILAAEAARP
jgi:pimeloyl-ACP methyl ester carboxylesterase